MMRFAVDARWRGNFGIARFGGEVTRRLPSDWPRLNGREIWLPSLSSLAGARYSPGFNVGLEKTQILTVHDLIHLDFNTESSALKRLYYQSVVRPAILRAGVVHTVSEYSRRRIEMWLGTGRVRILNVGNAVDRGVFRIYSDVTRVYGTFLYVGNLKPHKNAEVLWQALALRRNYSLDVVTGDTVEATRLSAQYGVETRVRLHSAVSDDRLAGLYARTTGLLFPSVIEGFGLPPLEARATGTRTAFSSECEAAVETVGNFGMAVEESQSPAAWAKAMDELMDDQPGAPSDAGLGTWDDVAAKVRGSVEETFL